MIYFDNNATTKIDERVLKDMWPFLSDNYANAASTHALGRSVSAAITDARETIARSIACRPGELVFCSGATEALNIAIKGAAFGAVDGRNKIITVATEHKAVLDTCAYLEQVGFEIVYLPVDQYGVVSIRELQKALDEQTIAVCVMLVNNETGTVQPLAEIVRQSRAKGALIICDASQAFGKLPVDVKELDVDMLVLSAHKFHGPKGAGVLYLKNGVVLSPTSHGGGQESGLRSGTLNVPQIIGMARACELAVSELDANSTYVRNLRDLLERELLRIPGTRLNGHPLLRSNNVVNISFTGIDANVLIAALPELAVSNGSACTAAVFEPSHVLTAMGISKEEAYASIRFSLSKFNTVEEVEAVLSLLTHYLSRIT
ncbi:cysteine desulfurase family protein [Mucilaginibacter myungsuensis]|uniref:cysteine desulfurase n=1 Tax=Mucilaginibacter myungsuensis TaxID=649104 RepID=A0A929KWP7_9SPHI|nr:cysteine desulfurase family protein [Mucilaginibacter myungsuensis]MBE9663024.1 cysteine desulfurase [Mucilaginibacter myungsuensis]MDN3598654.1 cysteine desulfurase family protein [Mucilaginibacter myungsuensis]